MASRLDANLNADETRKRLICLLHTVKFRLALDLRDRVGRGEVDRQTIIQVGCETQTNEDTI